jgi:predicted nucleic acid-binding protein
MNQYVLDTSALLAYIENEDGTAAVEALLQEAIDDEAELYVSVVSCIEVFYISWQEQGKDIATERLELINDLIIFQEPVVESLIKIIGELKASNTMSFADCCIAGLARAKQATLVHKDPEFEQVQAQIQQLKLPYKPKTRRS